LNYRITRPKNPEKTMFQTVQIVMDVFGRPIFVVPVALPASGCLIQVGDEALEFLDGDRRLGRISDVAPEILALVAAQAEVGLISYPENSREPCPDSLTHIASVRDLREAV
jgi:hypothetical protein